MATTQEKISQLEQDASQLVTNLEELHKKAGDYNTAKDELQKTNSELIQLIKETKTLSEESHKIISIINEIGSAKIFNKLEKIDKLVLIITILLILTLAISVVIYLK